MPSLRWFCLTTGSGDYEVVRRALDLAWAAGNPRQPAEWGAMRKRVMGAAPDAGDPELFPGAAVAQNAVAAVCYALEARLTGELQPAVWAARQLYEAADAVVQQGAAVQAYVGEIDREQPVVMMLAGIAAALDEVSGPGAADLRSTAEMDGEGFLAIVSGRA